MKVQSSLENCQILWTRDMKGKRVAMLQVLCPLDYSLEKEIKISEKVAEFLIEMGMNHGS